jgi:hypothetical protein
VLVPVPVLVLVLMLVLVLVLVAVRMVGRRNQGIVTTPGTAIRGQ